MTHYTIAQIAAGQHATHAPDAFPCSEWTVRRAIKAGKFRADLLNPDASPNRWEWRVPDTDALRNWRPRRYARKSADA